MNYGELFIKGKTTEEILLSTYVCHPSMANNELSGPAVATYIANIIAKKGSYYSYRILFLPETIGSIYYISRHLEQMRKNIIAGYVITCVGDDNEYSFLPTRNVRIIDRAAMAVFKCNRIEYKQYSWLERVVMKDNTVQFVDLPIYNENKIWRIS